MLLAQVTKGQKVTIVSLNLSDSGVRRLSSLGLFPGVRVRVVDNSIPETSLIECKGTRLALGRGISRLIEVN